MSIFKHKRTGRWVAQISERGHKRQLGTFATQRDAKAAVTAYEQSRPAATMTIASWREAWLLSPQWKESTRIHNRERTAAFAERYGNLHVGDLTRVQARDWLLKYSAQHGALSAMFGAAVYADIVTANPFHKLVKRTTKKRDLQPEWLTEPDVVELEAAAYKAHGPVFGATVAGMIRFAVETGVRPGELFVIEDRDLDPKNGALYVRRAASGLSRTVTTPKNGEAREVVLSDRAAEAAAQAMRWPGTDRVFSSITGQQFWPNSFSWVWKPVKSVAGRPDMHFYELRHLCATRLLEGGVSDADVATQLGHTDGGELIRRVYGHPSVRQSRDRIRKHLNGEEAA